MRIRRLALCGLLLVGHFVGCPEPPARAQSLEEVRSGNLSTLQSIQTFSCRVIISQNTAGKTSSFSGDYWRSGDTVRSRYTGPEVISDLLIKDGKSILLEKGVKRRFTRAQISPANDLYRDGDVWGLALQSFTAPEPGTVLPFDELLKKPHNLRKVAEKFEGGRKLIYVDLEHNLSHLQFWFDPQVNFLVRKHTVTAKNQPTEIRSEYAVTRFKEASPGIFFPEAVEGRHYGGGQLTTQQTVNLNDVRVNQPLPVDVFFLRLPEGTDVVDNILGKRYTVDANGRPVGPMRDLIRMASAPPGVTPRTETREEPRPLTRWILPASVLLLIVAGLIWSVRKWKQATKPTAP